MRCVKMLGKCLNSGHASRLDEGAAKASLICELHWSLAWFYLALMGLKDRVEPSSEFALFLHTHCLPPSVA